MSLRGALQDYSVSNIPQSSTKQSSTMSPDQCRYDTSMPVSNYTHLPKSLYPISINHYFLSALGALTLSHAFLRTLQIILSTPGSLFCQIRFPLPDGTYNPSSPPPIVPRSLHPPQMWVCSDLFFRETNPALPFPSPLLNFLAA